MSSSEQEPLLPSSNPPDQPEQADRSLPRGRLSTWRIRVAEALESAYVHKLVITLVRIFSFPNPFTLLLHFDNTKTKNPLL